MTNKQVIQELKTTGTVQVNGYQLDYGFCEVDIYKADTMEHVATFGKWDFLDWLDENNQ